MIMFINGLHLYTIVSSFILINYVRGTAPSGTFEILQLGRQWFEIAVIPSSGEISPQQCIMYDIAAYKDYPEYDFVSCRIPIEAISGCEYGIPISPYAKRGFFRRSPINASREESHVVSSINSYNNGREIILTEPAMESGGAVSYRLWSRTRQVSPATKAEFEKLAENRTAIFYSWDLCPKIQKRTDKKLTLEQVSGTWYGIVDIDYESVVISECKTWEIEANYENQTFTVTQHRLIAGQSETIKIKGKVLESNKDLVLSRNHDDNLEDYFTVEPISCNNGADLVLRPKSGLSVELFSRNPKVSTEMMAEFERVSKKHLDANFYVHPQDNCPGYVHIPLHLDSMEPILFTKELEKNKGKTLK